MNVEMNSSPHIHSPLSTRRIMLDVLIALLPAFLAGAARLGWRALAVGGVSVAAALGSEALVCALRRRGCIPSDGSAAVTGLLLAMTLPVSVPLWQTALGAAFAVIVAKEMGGGLGQNAFNPALAARALLMLLFPASISRYPALDGVSSATPLHRMVLSALPQESPLDLLLGNCSGSIGEISSIALLAGGAYLIYRRVISPHIPLACIGTVAALSLLLPRAGSSLHSSLHSSLQWMLCQLLSGGLLLGAIFMATDYSSSPVTPRGQAIYGALCGGLIVLLRSVGIYPEGVTYAILIANALAGGIDRLCIPRRFGVQRGGRA